jgi:hypothetical protein
MNIQGDGGVKHQQGEVQTQYGTKIAAMVVVLVIDLALNSTLDYDSYNDQYNGRAASRLLLGLFGLQVVIEIAVFLVLFLAMADTFLFRVGLLGMLIKKFRTVLVVHPIYFALTIATGAYRVRKFINSATLFAIWHDQSFIALYYIQKFISIPYYMLNLRAVIKLSDPIYFDSKVWMDLMKSQRRQFR